MSRLFPLGGLLAGLVLAPVARGQDSTYAVSVTIRGMRAHAADLAQAAIIGAGYAIDRATDNAIVSTPSGPRGGWSKYRVQVHASLLGAGADSTRIVLSELATSMLGVPIVVGNGGAIQAPPGRALVSPKQKHEWREMLAIRDAIARAAASDSTRTAPASK